VVRAIYNLRVLLSKYDDFRNDVSARKLDGGDVAPWPHGRRKGDADIIFNADGSVDAPQTNVIETNEILAGEIRRSVEKFGVALKWDKPAEEVQ
jgi:hypothetical protein